MSVSHIWRLAGCGTTCQPRGHDPLAHEVYGLRLGVLAYAPAARAVRTGPLVVDLDTPLRVTVDGQSVDLTEREWSILAYLASHVGTLVRSEEVIAAVWGPEYVTPDVRYTRADGSDASRVDHHLLNVNIHRLRQKLGPAASLLVSSRNREPRRCLAQVEPT